MIKNRGKDREINRKYVNILGINVLSTTKDGVLTAIEEKVSSSIKFSILTPNPELVLASTSNPLLKEALNSADFAIPDGVGLNYASEFISGETLNIIPGRKLFLDLINLASKNKWRVFLLGGLNNEVGLAIKNLISLYPNISISSDKGMNLNEKGEPDTKVDIKLHSDVIKKINNFKPHLLFVAFGNPKQEIWIHNNLSKLNVNGVMAVGGTFRYIAGVSALPPKWMERTGLEWLWRLVTEPVRLKRIINAVIVFPWKVFVFKLNRKN